MYLNWRTNLKVRPFFIMSKNKDKNKVEKIKATKVLELKKSETELIRDVLFELTTSTFFDLTFGKKDIDYDKILRLLTTLENNDMLKDFALIIRQLKIIVDPVRNKKDKITSAIVIIHIIIDNFLKNKNVEHT